MNSVWFKTTLAIHLLIIPSDLFPQHLGIGGGFTTSSAIFGELFFQKEPTSFHLGGTWQITDARGKRVTEQKANYGRTAEGSGSKYYSIDLGVGYLVFDKKFQVNGELSAVLKEYYTNYKDARFTGGGYYLVNKSEYYLGIGVNVGCYVVKNLSIIAGFNTYRQGIFGLRYAFAK